MQQAMPKTPEVVVLPHFKPDEVEALKVEHERRKLAAKIRPTLNPDDERVRDAIQREGFWRSQPKSKHRDEELAHCLFTQGRIDEALELSIDPERRAYFESIKFAIQRDDDVFCDCPDVDWQVTHKVPSPKHGGRMAEVGRCAKCGDMNITV